MAPSRCAPGATSAAGASRPARPVNPAARVVYVDNDPIVLPHAQALMRGTREGATTYIEADLRDPAPVLRQAAAASEGTVSAHGGVARKAG